MPSRHPQTPRLRPHALSPTGDQFKTAGYIGLNIADDVSSGNTINFVLSALRLQVGTEVMDVTEEMHTSAGAATNSGTSTGTSANVHGSTVDVANFYSMGYPTGKVMMRGEMPVGGALALTTDKFDTVVETTGYESTTDKIITVSVSLGNGGANKDHWLTFQMLYFGIEIEWARASEFVNFTLKGQLTGVLSTTTASTGLPSVIVQVSDEAP